MVGWCCQVDKKRRFLKKLADAVVNLYNQIKAEIVTDKTALEKTESTVRSGGRQGKEGRMLPSAAGGCVTLTWLLCLVCRCS